MSSSWRGDAQDDDEHVYTIPGGTARNPDGTVTEDGRYLIITNSLGYDAEMRIIGFITEPSLVKRILDHIRKRDRASRSPPHPQPAVAHIA